MLLWKAQSHQKQQQNFPIGEDRCFSDWNSVKIRILKEFVKNSEEIYLEFLTNLCEIMWNSWGIYKEFTRNLEGILEEFMWHSWGIYVEFLRNS